MKKAFFYSATLLIIVISIIASTKASILQPSSKNHFKVEKKFKPQHWTQPFTNGGCAGSISLIRFDSGDWSYSWTLICGSHHYGGSGDFRTVNDEAPGELVQSTLTYQYDDAASEARMLTGTTKADFTTEMTYDVAHLDPNGDDLHSK